MKQLIKYGFLFGLFGLFLSSITYWNGSVDFYFKSGFFLAFLFFGLYFLWFLKNFIRDIIYYEIQEKEVNSDRKCSTDDHETD